MSSKLFPPVDPASRRRQAPAAARNRAPILDVLRRVFDRPGTILEIASGTGEHAVYFAGALPHLIWQPSDLELELRQSVDAWIVETGVANVLPAIAVDAAADVWPIDRADGILCCNMIHIAPPAAGEGLLRGAARTLRPGGRLVVYGPFREGGVHTAASNERFDADLQARNPAWGVRDLDDVVARAAALALRHVETVRMPANNLLVIFEQTHPQ